MVVNSSEVAAGVTDMAVKVPAHTVAPKTVSSTTSREPASLRCSEIDGNFFFKSLLQSFMAFHEAVNA